MSDETEHEHDEDVEAHNKHGKFHANQEPTASDDDDVVEAHVKHHGLH